MLCFAKSTSHDQPKLPSEIEKSVELDVSSLGDVDIRRRYHQQRQSVYGTNSRSFLLKIVWKILFCPFSLCL